ncbi:MAG: winged helix-turn-helix domain-containing protein [Eubacteriales bacterium]|nr:winged helix-turn-helix domain-containing protein [Eubacteriales bacterium]
MVNILVIDSREGDGILNEVIDFLSRRTYCQVTQLSSDYNMSSATDVLTFPGLEIRSKEQMVYRDGGLVSMSHHEFFTLLYLAQHPGWVFSKEQIYETVWKKSGGGGAAVVSVVSQIRRKIGDKYIRTVVGSGYKFEA